MKTPRRYQLEAIDIIKRRNLLLRDECGLGKTLEAIEAAKIIQAQFNAPVLIICPKSIVDQWQGELTEQGIILPDPNWYVFHYEAVVKYNDHLADTYWACIIVDEGHRIKNRDKQRTLAIKGGTYTYTANVIIDGKQVKQKKTKTYRTIKCHRKLAMTGTPFDANPADVWSILNWLEPQFFTSYWRFYNSHVNYSEIQVRRGQTVKVINKAQPVRNPENFARLLRQFSLRRTKKDVRPDLPDRIDQFIDLTMNSDQASYYHKIIDADDFIVDLDEGNEQFITIVLTRILKLIQITTDPTLLGVKSSSVKLEWVMEWLEDNPNESVIIFTRFRDTAIKLHKDLHSQSLDFTLLIGGTKRPTITSANRLIVGTIAAMGEGLDLPHIDNAIFIDVEWSSILMQQAIDRIHRINIDNVKHLYFLRCQNTVDELVHTAVRNKWNTKTLVENFIRGQGITKP